MLHNVQVEQAKQSDRNSSSHAATKQYPFGTKGCCQPLFLLFAHLAPNMREEKLPPIPQEDPSPIPLLLKNKRGGGPI